MIKRIKKIRNLGIFSNYQGEEKLSEFSRYNIIYGWNGSGKTTLSKLFTALEKGFSDKHPALEYEIDTDNGSIKNGQPFTGKIRVFNRDYVSSNLSLMDGKTKPIFILGEENKNIAKEIQEGEGILSEKLGDLNRCNEKRERLEKDKGKIFTDIARTISSNTSGEATRKYDKRDAETEFLKINSKELLTADEIEAMRLALRQLEKPSMQGLDIPKTSISKQEFETEALLNRLFTDSEKLCKEIADVAVIERLNQNLDLLRWVEQGFLLHNKHNSDNCEYCCQKLPEARTKALNNLFNQANLKMKGDIDKNVSDLNEVYSVINKIDFPDKANLYDELQETYQEMVGAFGRRKNELLKATSALVSQLNEKRAKTSDVMEFDKIVDIKPFILAMDNVNVEIKKHNEKTTTFQQQKETSRKKLEAHFLSSVYDEIKQIEEDISSVNIEINALNDGDSSAGFIGLKKLKEQIESNKKKISSSHIGCDAMNQKLKAFLGMDEIVLTVEGDGYVIKRNGIQADNLSEGEKTAITFVYFIVHLKDQNFNASEGIIVIDDPVSSLDSNSTYQAFAFLKHSVEDAKQVFVFTHNFDFLRLLLNWTFKMKFKNRCYFMIKNVSKEGNRHAYIAALDKALLEHESEYHYLFKILYEFQSDGSIGQSYPIPNIARKVLDTFLMFRVPNSQNMYNKLQELKPFFDDVKLTAIWKFVNDHSHVTGKGFDPSLVPETKRSVEYLLDLIKTVFPEHYEILVTSFPQISNAETSVLA